MKILRWSLKLLSKLPKLSFLLQQQLPFQRYLYGIFTSSFYLCPCFPRRLSFSCHCSLKLLRESCVFSAEIAHFFERFILQLLTSPLAPLWFPRQWSPHQGLSWKCQCIRYLCVLCLTCIAKEMLSRSLRISWRFFVPRMFLSEVWASKLEVRIMNYKMRASEAIMLIRKKSL